MTVKIETVATAAPTGIQFTFWASVPSSGSTHGDVINWTDNTGDPNLWVKPQGTTGERYEYLASGIIVVPLAKAGSIEITATLGTTNDKGTTTVKFSDWGASPSLNDVIYNKMVNKPGPQQSNGIVYSAQVVDTGGTAIDGAEVQWRVSPKSPIFTTFDTVTGNQNNGVRGKHWVPMVTDSTGYSKINLLSTRTVAATMIASTPVDDAIMPGSNGTAYFVNPDDPLVFEQFAQPQILGVENGYIDVTDKIIYGEVLPNIQDPYDTDAYQAFLYVEGNGGDVPWTAPNASIFQSPVPVNSLSIATLTIGGGIHSNKSMFFLQDIVGGNVFKSGMSSFGASGTFENKPDPKITNRPFYAPAPNPDPGVGGLITHDNLIAQNPNGLKLQYARTLGTGFVGSAGKLYFVYYLNGVDKDGINKDRRIPVEAVEPVTTSTTYYHAILPYGQATGYWPNPNDNNSYGPFYAEMIWIPTGEDSNPAAWTYSQYNQYVLATGWPGD